MTAQPASPLRLALPAVLPAGVLPRERGKVGFDPAGPRPRAGQGGRAVEAGQQPLIEQSQVVAGEGGEVALAAFGHVVPDQFYPGPADGRVVLLRRSRVAGGALDPVADQADGLRNAAAPHGQPRQMDVFTVAEPRRARHHLGHQRVERSCAALAHRDTSVRACSAVRRAAIVSAGRGPSACCSMPVMACRIVAAAWRPEAVSSTSTPRRSPSRRLRVMRPRRSSRSRTLVSVVGRVPAARPSSDTLRPRPSARLAKALISEPVRPRSASSAVSTCKVAWVARCNASSADHPGAILVTISDYTISDYRMVFSRKAADPRALLRSGGQRR